jgi:hypothetical protein
MLTMKPTNARPTEKELAYRERSAIDRIRQRRHKADETPYGGRRG